MRAIGQLWGSITYDQSEKEKADAVTSLKEQEIISTIRRIGSPLKKSKKTSSLKGDDKKYFDSCSMSTDFISQGVVSREKAIPTSYDYELQQMQNADIHAWDITSKVNFLLIYICNFHVLNNLLLIYICKLHWNLNTMFVCQVNFLLIYICNFHVLSHSLLIYICKLHWNIVWSTRGCSASDFEVQDEQP